MRILSGMRTTGDLHLGHYHGVLKNWLDLQNNPDYECIFFAADWHALTTHYADSSHLADSTRKMIITWLACGIDPQKACITLQSRTPQHAVLHVLLSMITPLSWLERVPTYKDQQQKLGDKDLSTYGFLGYPLLQAADILIYKAQGIPVGEDQVPHVEFSREIARRFNHLYGLDAHFQETIEKALNRLDAPMRRFLTECRTAYQQSGDEAARAQALTFLKTFEGCSEVEYESLIGYVEGRGRIILPEPQALLTKSAKMPGLDGQKMSKSYHNTIPLNASDEIVEASIRKMPTDPARVRRTDPGNPEKCPVWKFHEVYSDPQTRAWVDAGCRSAGIGCLECKKPVIQAICTELAPIRDKATLFEKDPAYIDEVIAAGTQRSQQLANATLDEVNQAMGILRQ